MLPCARLDDADGLLLMDRALDVDLLLDVVFSSRFLVLTDVWLWFWSWLEHDEWLLPACCDWPLLWEARCSETVFMKTLLIFHTPHSVTLLYHKVKLQLSGRKVGCFCQTLTSTPPPHSIILYIMMMSTIHSN